MKVDHAFTNLVQTVSFSAVRFTFTKPLRELLRATFMNPPSYRTARALYPHRPELWEPEYLYEPLPVPADHPELDLWGFTRVRRENEAEDVGALAQVRMLETPGDRLSTLNLKPEASDAEPLRARMLNEFVYCPRLFYYEQVEGVFVSNADTERGSAIHEKVDRGKGSLPKAKKRSDADTPVCTSEPTGKSACATESESDLADLKTHAPDDAEPKEETIHSRSAMLSSTRLGVVAKMDLVEVQVKRRVDGAMADLFAPRHLDVQSVTPVDYKAGAPKIGAEQNELWDADKMQLGLQILILREMATPAMKGSFTTAPQSSACPCA